MIPPNAGGKKCFYHEHCDSCLGAASNQLFRFQDFEVVQLLQIRSNLKDDEMTLHTAFSYPMFMWIMVPGTLPSSGSFLPGIWRKENVYAPEPVGWNSCGDLMSYSAVLMITSDIRYLQIWFDMFWSCVWYFSCLHNCAWFYCLSQPIAEASIINDVRIHWLSTTTAPHSSPRVHRWAVR